MSFIVFDIGGTSTRIARTRDLKTFEDKVKFDTPASFIEAMAAMHEVIESLADGPIEAIGGGVRGILNDDRTAIVKDAVLTEWVEQPLAYSLGAPWKCPVVIENDTATVALGEANHGAGQGNEIVVYHTVSTGVGGARIVHGALAPASYGFEPGHQILDIDRTILGADVAPTLENMISGTAVERRFAKPACQIPQSEPLWNELAAYLAQGLRNTIMYWSPDIIVLGGSMIVGDPKIQIAEIRKQTAAVVDGKVPCPEIVEASLGDDGGLYGAMCLIDRRL